MNPKHITTLRLESLPQRAREHIVKHMSNIAERTFGEEFLRLSQNAGMTKRYMQSLKISNKGTKLIMELDYVGRDNGEPLGIWFESGTRDHYIAPVTKKYLSWIDPDTGQRRYSLGHDVRGIKATHIIEKMVDHAFDKFATLLTDELKTFLAETGKKWSKQ